MSLYSKLQERYGDNEMRINSTVNRVRIFAKELLRRLIQEGEFPEANVWFAESAANDHPVDDPIAAMRHDSGGVYRLLMILRIETEPGKGFIAHAPLRIEFDPTVVTIRVKDPAPVRLENVPSGSDNGLKQLVSDIVSQVGLDMDEFGTRGSSVHGVIA